MELKNNIYVVSFTHWDREWLFPFEKTRMLLVKMMDSVLDLLDTDPDYQCFHLDGQTILLEDYCQVRPENKEKIRNYVKQGRLMIGPWLVLPEENQMSGESIVRNFLWGERIGREYGGNMKVGYSPTSWGQISQMPQIMNGFNLNSIIFYRGISADQSPDNYYIWQGPDGSKLLGIRLGDYARVSFFHLVDRAVAFKRYWGEETHEWEEGGKPFRVSGTGTATPYEFFQPPIGWHPEELEGAVKLLEEKDLGKWMTSWALSPECDDCTGPFALTTKIIKEINKKITNGKQIAQGKLPEFVEMASKEIDLDKLKVLKGEMRNPQRAGQFTDVYAEIHACRIPTKYKNRRAEFELQRVAEPLATVAYMMGEEYPKFFLDRAWYLLLQNHAHDSIGGCGRDAVDEDVRYRLNQVQILADSITNDMACKIAGKIDTSNIAPEEVLIVVFNTLPRKRSQVVDVEIDFQMDKGIQGIQLCDIHGNEIECQINGKSQSDAIFNHPFEVPRRMHSTRWEMSFNAKDIPGLGYKVFRVISQKEQYRHTGTMLTGFASMANEFMEVNVNSNGSVNIKSFKTGQVLEDQNIFEDRGDVGDYWVGAFPVQDRLITSSGVNADIAVIENGAISVAIEAKITLNLPSAAAFDATNRLETTKPVNIKTVYRLNKGEKFLRIKTTVENTVEDHILRTLFPTKIETNVAHAQTAFDVVERDIPLPDTRNWREPYKPVQPHLNFVELSDNKKGVAVLNKGLPQYEAVDDKQRTIALTLLRSIRAWNSIRLARYPDQPGTQLQGTYTFEYAIFPHKGNWEVGQVLYEAEKFNIPPVIGVAGPGKGELPKELSFVELNGQGLVLNSLKKGEWDDSVIVRISNPTSKEIKGLLKLSDQYHVKKAISVKLNEVDVEEQLCTKDNSVDIGVPPKKIITIKLFQ